MNTEDVAALLRGYRFYYSNEEKLQRGITEALREVGLEVEREVRLPGRRGRIDMLVDERIGIEVKVKCPLAQLERQVRRYLSAEQIEGIVVVAMTPRHYGLPTEIAGKPVEVVSIASKAL